MKHHPILKILLITLALIVVSACSTLPDNSAPATTGSFQTVTGRDLRIATGQTIYVPAYSEIFLGRQNLTIDLAVTLAIHNTDLNSPIIVQSVRYYDTDGNVVRDYIEDPIEIPPLATSGFLVSEDESVAGWGANFVVEWVAEDPVHEPIVEAIMVSTQGTHGVSMISLGRVISRTPSDATTTETTE